MLFRRVSRTHLRSSAACNRQAHQASDTKKNKTDSRSRKARVGRLPTESRNVEIQKILVRLVRPQAKSIHRPCPVETALFVPGLEPKRRDQTARQSVESNRRSPVIAVTVPCRS